VSRGVIKIAKTVFAEFVYGGHLLSLGLVCVVLLATTMLDIEATFEFMLAVYLLSLGPCLFGRYVDLKKDDLTNRARSTHLNKTYKIIPFVVFLCILSVVAIFVYANKSEVLLFAVGLIAMSVVYDLKLKKLTKKIVGFKNIYVGLIFALLPVMAYVYYLGFSFSASSLIVFAYVFIMAAMGAAFSDIKDIDTDKADGLKTFAVVLGHHRLIKYLTLVCIGAYALIVLAVIWGLIPTFSLSLILVIFYNFLMFKMSMSPIYNRDYLYSMLFDAQLVLWYLFLLSGKILYEF
jgi:4-hydroxybenzoate polyprenyltransferase